MPRSALSIGEPQYLSNPRNLRNVAHKENQELATAAAGMPTVKAIFADLSGENRRNSLLHTSSLVPSRRINAGAIYRRSELGHDFGSDARIGINLQQHRM